MVHCECCDEDVEVLTKTTGTCPQCAKEEVENGDGCFDIDDETSVKAQGANMLVEHHLRKEGFELEELNWFSSIKDKRGFFSFYTEIVKSDWKHSDGYWNGRDNGQTYYNPKTGEIVMDLNEYSIPIEVIKSD